MYNHDSTDKYPRIGNVVGSGTIIPKIYKSKENSYLDLKGWF